MRPTDADREGNGACSAGVLSKERVKERATERAKERETERETEREKERAKERETERETEREKERETEVRDGAEVRPAYRRRTAQFSPDCAHSTTKLRIERGEQANPPAVRRGRREESGRRRGAREGCRGPSQVKHKASETHPRATHTAARNARNARTPPHSRNRAWRRSAGVMRCGAWLRLTHTM